MRPRALTAAAGALILTGVLAACGAASPEAQVGVPAASMAAALDEGRAPAPQDTSGSGTGTGVLAGVTALVDRKIVKTGEITLEVNDVGAAVGIVRAMALDLGGYVGGSSAGDAEQTASLTLRIPADRFDDALDRLHAMDAKLIAESTREEDVTASVVDLQARIENLQASEAQYRTLLDRAEKIDDILSVQSRLDDVRGQIEQLTAQLKQLSGLADLSTLTVTLTPHQGPVTQAAESWDPGATLDGALAALVGLGQALATAGIWLLIVGLPVLVLVALLALIGFRLVPRLPRRGAGGPAA